MKKFAIAAVLAAGSFLSAHAASITGLVNTGSFASGQQDTNYSLNSTGYGFVTSNGSFPLGPWMANSTTSKWITPTAAQGATSAAGTYTWSLNFDLTGFDAATASFDGKFAADNSAVVKLNGTKIGYADGFKSFYNFGAATGFNSGVNTLDFVVTNYAGSSGNPTGLRVEFTASNVTPVPEPETYAMLLAGLGLMGVISRRRAKRNAA
ncbi:MAG: PEP-CTERM sorting domain-containing protein [Rhodoferax sp.]|uniref:PEP-CTERM sorting domain-containing protein n=1 Tax=Rhodoferax sp. TaxID=50421 RepID=UPI002ACDF09E|nr:PEP-CTERM sorting domain-containing protein [Rhodoferax sp.]MDZ7890710.1 PEP-CTERM sorting domain-containing protein [Rhodoferax sp.]